MSLKAEKLQNSFEKAEIIKPLRKTKKAYAVHIVVALVGLALTCALYLGSTQLIQTIVQERKAEMTSDLVKNQLQKFKTHIDILTPINYQQAKQLAQQAELSGLDNPAMPFNFLALFETDRLGSKLKPLAANPEKQDITTFQPMISNSNLMANFLDQKLHSYAPQTSEHIVISTQSLYDELNYLGANGSKKILFIKEFLLNDGAKQAWLIAEDHVDAIFKTMDEESQAPIALISMSDVNTATKLYHYEKTPNLIKDGLLRFEAGALFDKDTQIVSYAGNQWQIDTQLYKDKTTLIFEKIPYIAGASGLVFVLMSLVQAFLQSIQDRRIHLINNVLEQKNQALEQAMGQREELDHNLKKSEQENLALMNAVSDIIFEADSNGNMLFLNEAWTRITGFEAGASLDKNLFNMLHPDDQPRELESFEKLLQGQKSAYRSVTRLRCIDGTYRAVELSFSMIRRAGEGRLKVVGSITDIEERHRAEQALGEVEKKYQAIVENAAWGIYQMTPEGIYLSANTAMISALGYESRDQLLHTIDNAHEQVYLNPQERQAFLREVAASGSINAHETRIKSKDGQQIWVLENIRAVKDEDGNILYYEGSIENISDRKEADIMLRDAKMHSDMANRAKSEFLTNMSHELRTPLNAIIGFSEILQTQSLGPIGNESYKEYIDEIHSGGKRLMHIINEIIDISRIEVRERELNESTVDIAKTMQTCITLLENQAHTHQIEVKNLLENPPKIIAEERALKQIFTNILSNAIKFTPRGGHVTLRHEITSNGNLNISFADTGVGLDVEEIKKALSPFGQVGSSLDQSNAGTGLGLTLVKALTELHGGKVDIFSQKGMGTTVTVQLPMARIVKPVNANVNANAT